MDGAIRSAIKTILVVTFMYKAYDEVIGHLEADLGKNKRTKRQDVDDLQERKRLVSFSRKLLKIIITIHVALAIKYSLIGLLYLDSFAKYRIYDCYILGRASFNSKLYLPNVILMLIIIAYSLSYRFIMISRIAPSFNYELVTFLQMKPEEVFWNEIQLRTNSVMHCHNLSAQPRSNGLISTVDRYSISEGMRVDNMNRHGRLKFYFLNPFHNQPDKQDSILLRPNRTLDARNKSISRIATFCIGTSMIFFCMGIALLSLFSIGKTFTAKGFLLNYNLCVDYIRTLGRNQSSDFTYIYDINNTYRAGQEEIFFRYNLYHTIRSSVDLFDDVFIWTDSLVASVLHSLLMVLQVLDLIVYINLLEQNLISSLDLMRKHSNATIVRPFQSNPVCTELTMAERESKPTRCQSAGESKNYSATTLQAYLLDYLRLVKSYQTYSSFQVAAMLAIWMIFSGCISFWLALNKNVEISEFRWAQPCLACAAAYLMSVSAYFEMRSRKLYHYICVAMALDTDVIASKHRWLYLTKFFYSNPMHCFAFFGRTGLSWLFCIKVSA